MSVSFLYKPHCEWFSKKLGMVQTSILSWTFDYWRVIFSLQVNGISLFCVWIGERLSTWGRIDLHQKDDTGALGKLFMKYARVWPGFLFGLRYWEIQIRWRDEHVSFVYFFSQVVAPIICSQDDFHLLWSSSGTIGTWRWVCVYGLFTLMCFSEQVHLCAHIQALLLFYLGHQCSGILKCKDATEKKSTPPHPVFQTFLLFAPPSSLSRLLCVPIKGQWISFSHFHVTSSVFDFCLLEIGHGVNIESFDQSCQELDLFILFIWWWPLNGGAYIWQGHALMWALITAGHRGKRGPGLSNGRRWRKDDYRCAWRASEPFLCEPLCSNTYLTPYRWPPIMIKKHRYPATFVFVFPQT